jgi:hypothetical protein
VSRATLVRAGVALAVLALCAIGFFSCFERREVEVETGVSAAARRNPYLALARLLERMGHTVVVQTDPTRLDALPEPPATLILPTPRYSIGAERSEALLDWVSRGGHLAVVTYTLWRDPEASDEDGSPHTRPDFILDRFGLRQEAVAPEPEKEKQEGAEPTRDRPVLEGAWADFDAGHPLEVTFSPQFRWLDPEHVATWTVAGSSGVHLVELRHGRGRVSAFTSDEPLLNTRIAERDNAEFAVRWLRRDAAGDGPIWIYYEEDWPSVLVLVREHAMPAAIAGAALLGVWLWSAVFRFGPVLPEPSRARRSWLEHLDAAGRFHWRQDHGRALLAAMREEVSRRARERHPGWRDLAERERLARVAERTGLTPAEVEHALAGPPGGARAFAASVSALERIRAAL